MKGVQHLSISKDSEKGIGKKAHWRQQTSDVDQTEDAVHHRLHALMNIKENKLDITTRRVVPKQFEEGDLIWKLV
jgi:hypothetical protein